MESLKELLEEQLKDLYSAEKQLTKALPAMAKKASSPSLKKAIQSHLEETNNQIKRLDSISEHMETRLSGKKCKAMEGLIEEGKEVLKESGDDNVIDAAIIAAAQRVEHYEISGYGSARAVAEHLGLDEVAQLLQETLDEESACDEKLSAISLNEIIPGAPTGDEEVEEEEEEETVSAGSSAKRGGRR